jgi:tetrahydromethanopterin:alpha-L-glutamate ligase
VRRRVLIVTDDPGWHGARLRKAFAARAVESIYASLVDCAIDVAGGSQTGIVIPGFSDGLPDGAFVRGVPGGSLEQVVLRLDVLHALRELGIPVYNDARAIERTVDKAMTSFLLHRAGVPTPATWVCESEPAARAVLRRETAGGGAMVMKPLFGSQGKGLLRLSANSRLPDAALYGGVYYLQRYIDTGEGGWHDWRVLVIGGRARSAMVRYGTHWITNRAQGARCERAALQGQLGRLAEEAVRAVGTDYAGVDLMRDARGRLLVVEVNGIPAWKGLQGVSAVDLAQALVDDFLGRLPWQLVEAAQ